MSTKQQAVEEMKSSHRRVIEALLRGCRLAQAGTIHGTYLVKSGANKWFQSEFSVHYRTIEEMRQLGLLVLIVKNGTNTLVPSDSAVREYRRKVAKKGRE